MESIVHISNSIAHSREYSMGGQLARVKHGYVIATDDSLREVTCLVQLHLAPFLLSLDGTMPGSKQGRQHVESGDGCPVKRDQQPRHVMHPPIHCPLMQQ